MIASLDAEEFDHYGIRLFPKGLKREEWDFRDVIPKIFANYTPEEAGCFVVYEYRRDIEPYYASRRFILSSICSLFGISSQRTVRDSDFRTDDFNLLSLFESFPLPVVNGWKGKGKFPSSLEAESLKEAISKAGFPKPRKGRSMKSAIEDAFYQLTAWRLHRAGYTLDDVKSLGLDRYKDLRSFNRAWKTAEKRFRKALINCHQVPQDV